MDNYTVDTIIMISKIIAMLLVIVGIPVIISRAMKKGGASSFEYQAVPILILFGLAVLGWSLRNIIL